MQPIQLERRNRYNAVDKLITVERFYPSDPP